MSNDELKKCMIDLTRIVANLNERIKQMERHQPECKCSGQMDQDTVTKP